MLKIISLAAALILTISVTAWNSFSETRQDLENSLIRLHILANSDSPEDQALKLQVRDAILEASSDWFSSCENLYQAEKILLSRQTDLENIANTVLLNAGSDDSARCFMTKNSFNTRVYETFTLPAGNYDSLRLELGDANGKNWWCVVYPQLCVSPAMAKETVPTETRFKVQFKIAEILQKYRSKPFKSPTRLPVNTRQNEKHIPRLP